MAGGSVYRRKDGRWAGEVALHGKRHTVYARSKREARDKLTALIAEGKAVERRRGTVGNAIARYLADVRHTHAPRTWERYEGLARVHVLPALGRVRLDRLTVEDCAAFQSSLLAKGLSPRSVKLCMGLLRSVLGPGSPAHGVRPPRLPPPRNRALSLEEARRLLAACRDDRERLLLWLTLGLGLRLGEACGVRWADIEEGRMLVGHQVQRMPPSFRIADTQFYHDAAPKGGQKRVLPVVQPLADILERVKEDRGEVGYVLIGRRGQHLSPRSAEYVIEVLALKAAVGPLRLHDLRHSAATFLAAAGVDAKTRMLLLGHRSVQVHAGYTHPDEAMLREAAERLGSALGVD